MAKLVKREAGGEARVNWKALGCVILMFTVGFLALAYLGFSNMGDP